MKFVWWLSVLVILLNGCARVTFYSDGEMKHKTGLKYFEAKPYLLVVRKAKDQVETQVIYLPDKTKPQYAKFSPGLGSHEFTVAVTNGMLTSYGQKADSKIPELIQSMTGLLAEAAKTAEKVGTFGMQAAANYTALATEVDSLAANLLGGVEKLPMSDEVKALDRVRTISDSLRKTAALLRVPVPDVNTVVQNLKNDRDNVALLMQPVPERFDPNSPVGQYNTLITVTAKRIDAVIAALKGEPVPVLPFELYEILQADNGRPTLRKVE